MAKVLYVDDEVRLVQLLVPALSARGHEAVGAHTGQEALDLLDQQEFDVVLTDMRMEPVDGMAVLRAAKEHCSETEVIVLTGHATDVQDVVAAMQAGACHYMTKPFALADVVRMVEKHARVGEMARENRLLKQAVAVENAGREMVGEAEVTAHLREMIARVAPSEATVLIRGESGTGKEVCARAVHNASTRAAGPFVAINCAAIPETLLESELFGYRQGAFTGADQDREGVFEAARGGTLFLDEIGEAPAPVQAKLLRVLEERKINRVGDPQEREVDVRILTATNRSLEEEISAGRFREDLYFRLMVFPLEVPPLRNRTDDITLLVRHFLTSLGRRQKELPATALKRLRAHPWPGNVRELRNIIERAHILAGPSRIGNEHIVLGPGSARADEEGTMAPGADLNLDNNARLLIRAAMQRAGGNKSLAAELLGITRRTLYSRLKLLAMEDEFLD
ncbi:hypothetical protein CSB20_11720 [bacterium DOLZORAL124_64_63]|nr:MAG: hypothetical protein CSB20_11720 [bacterium DOLZORAL124_64_63]